MPSTRTSFIRRPPAPADAVPSPATGAPAGPVPASSLAPSGIEWLPRHRPDRQL